MTDLPEHVRQTLRKIPDPDMRKICADFYRNLPTGRKLEQMQAEADQQKADKAQAIVDFDLRTHRRALDGEYGTEAKLMAESVTDEPKALRRLTLKLQELKGLEIK